MDNPHRSATTAVLSACLLIAFAGSCTKTPEVDPDQLVNAGRQIAIVRQFEEAFPGSIHFVSHATGEFGKPRWNSRAPLHDRYVVDLQFDVIVGKDGTLKEAGNTVCGIYEVETITVDTASGSVGSSSGVLSRFLTIDELKKVLDAGGDFSSIGIPLNKSAPVKGFKEHWISIG